MPIDYDKIVEGRRRNWESLKPEEIREREREAERERAKKEREAKGKEGFYARRKRLLDAAAAVDKRSFRRSMRQSILMVAVLVIIGGLYVAVTHFIKSQREASMQRTLATVQRQVEQGIPVLDMKTPIKAFGTWRSAWKRGDINTAVKLLSSRFMSKTSETKSPGDILQEYQRLHKDGRLDSVRDMTMNFASVQMLRIPRAPYRNEELAIFKSAPVEKFGQKGPGPQYIVAFSYSKADQNWHFADMREAKFFSVRWSQEAAIRPLRQGPGAMTYTEEGDAIQPGIKNRTGPGTRNNQTQKQRPPVTLK